MFSSIHNDGTLLDVPQAAVAATLVSSILIREVNGRKWSIQDTLKCLEKKERLPTKVAVVAATVGLVVAPVFLMLTALESLLNSGKYICKGAKALAQSRFSLAAKMGIKSVKTLFFSVIAKLGLAAIPGVSVITVALMQASLKPKQHFQHQFPL